MFTLFCVCQDPRYSLCHLKALNSFLGKACKVVAAVVTSAGHKAMNRLFEKSDIKCFSCGKMFSYRFHVIAEIKIIVLNLLFEVPLR